LITLSALASTFGGIVTPICFAVFRLMNSNFVVASTGRSCGFVPVRILSTYQAPRWPVRYALGPYDNRIPFSSSQPDRGSLSCVAIAAILLQGSAKRPLTRTNMPSVVCLERVCTASSTSLTDLAGFSVSVSPSFIAASRKTFKVFSRPGTSPLALWSTATRRRLGTASLNSSRRLPRKFQDQRKRSPL